MSTYVQDDIHVVPRFLLNVGLRYEYNSPPVEALNRFSVPDLVPSATCLPPPPPTFSVVGTNGIRGDLLADPHRLRSRSASLGGRCDRSAGWFAPPMASFTILPLRTSTSSRGSIPRFTTWRFIQQTRSLSGWVVHGAGHLYPDGKRASYKANDSPKFRDGYMQQWNADLQYEVLPNWMVDAAYVGSKVHI